ncbi:MAG: hypothetical protein ACYTGL_22905, partial [Planctomycetota bacterium]
MSRRHRGSTPLQGTVCIERLEKRQMLSAASVVHEGVAYFAPDGDRIDRMEIATTEWLSPVRLDHAVGQPTAFHVDQGNIFVAYGREVYRHNQKGNARTHLITAEYDVRSIHSDGGILFLNLTSGTFLSFRKTDYSIVDRIDTRRALVGVSIAPEAHRLFGRTVGSTPSDIAFVAYLDSGHFVGTNDSPYHGDFPSGLETTVFPGDQLVIDSSGTVYTTESLEYRASFVEAFDDITFNAYGDVVVRRDRTVTLYSENLLPEGSYTLQATPNEIFLTAESVVAVSRSGSTFQVESVEFSSFIRPTPGPSVEMRGLAFTPDRIEVQSDGTLLMLSARHRSVFRWNAVTQEILPSIPLIDTPTGMAWSETAETLYLSYESGLIRSINLGAEQHVEVPFAVLPGTPTGLAVAGDAVFAVDGSGAWMSHHTFDLNGQRVSSVDWNHHSDEYTWSGANQQMYYFSMWSPRDLMAEPIHANGTIGLKRDAPGHGLGKYVTPIRVSPDGSLVVLGSGVLHDAHTLERLPYTLGTTVTDVAWLSGRMYTIREESGAKIEGWNPPTYSVGESRTLTGKAHALMSVGDRRLVAVTIGPGGVPSFHVLGEGLVNVGPASITVQHTDGDTVVFEGGAGDVFEVSLTSPPVAQVHLTIESSSARLQADTDTLLFTSDNWSIPQSVALSAPDNEFADGSSRLTVSATVRSETADPDYSAIRDTRIPVTVVDDETAGFGIVASDDVVSLHESGTTESVVVALNGKPRTDVVLKVRSSNDDEFEVRPRTLVFTPDNWDTGQTVTLRGVDDDADDDDYSGHLTVSVADARSDNAFHSVPPQHVAVVVRDDEEIELPPTIDAVSDVVVPDEGLHTLTLTGLSSGAKQTQELLITASVGNDVLIENASVEFVQGSTTAELNLSLAAQPDTNYSTVTVNVMDSGPDYDLTTLDDNESTALSFIVALGSSSTLHLDEGIEDGLTLERRARYLQLSSGSEVVGDWDFSALDALTIVGTSGSETLTLAGDGRQLIPSGGLSFHAAGQPGDGMDTLAFGGEVVEYQ